MSIPYLCVLIAAVLPYLLVAYSKFFTKGYNNNSPREFLEKLEGRAKRANYAHLNSFEAFPAFAAAVIIANLRGVSHQTISLLAVSFILFRILYAICYIFNQASLRSLMWFLGISCVISLFVFSL